MQAGSDLPAGSRLAGRKTRVARGLLFGREGNLPFRLLRSLTGALGGGMGLCRQGLSLALSLGGETGRFPLGHPHVSRLNDRASRGLACEDDRIIGCRASLEASQVGLPRFGRRFETIDELVAFEWIHVRS